MKIMKSIDSLLLVLYSFLKTCNAFACPPIVSSFEELSKSKHITKCSHASRKKETTTTEEYACQCLTIVWRKWTPPGSKRSCLWM